MDVAVDFDDFDNRLTLSCEVYYLTIEAAPAALLGLAGVSEADWGSHGSLQIGSTRFGRAFWAAGATPGTVMLLVGADDETWDLSITLTRATVEQIVDQARSSQGGAGRPGQ